MGRLENKVALISGGSRGMGAAEAEMFAAEGAHVVIADILEDEGRKTASKIAETGARCLFTNLDVLKASDWESAISTVTSAFGKLDILVNNAGVTSRMMLLETSEPEWDRVMDINTKGTFLGIKTAIPAMKYSGGGSIVNISSQMGLVGADYISPQYQASKGAVRILTKSVAIQYASDNIRCNSIHPAPIETDMTADIRDDADSFQDMLRRIPMGRYGKPEEVAYAVLYLASDESSFVTGSEVVVDGGWTAQ
ncbi:MAG: glucose 1-dehydrogenase [SAR202 cluster bacterium]|jgi:cyclopentanol dehydrogenase|nr:MAG: glucose 1-dehydrogenase [SAR202 cluster bacterium]MEC7734257.1 glucose 1-dehydrogenase [Chloroflexota bacterium]|tara:strand:- start:5880 stop:6635 length:756 start_codon:yes stop_codon:yes gene_type:complete